MSKKILTLITFALTLIMTGCANQTNAVNKYNAMIMTPEKFNSIVEGAPQQDEFEPYRDLFDAYIASKQYVYYTDITLKKWNKNPLDEHNGYYLLLHNIGEPSKTQDDYEVVDHLGQAIKLKKTTFNVDSINFDKDHIKTDKDNGRFLQGQTVRVFYTLAKSDEYVLKTIKGPKSICKPITLINPSYDNLHEVILDGCQLQATVVDSILLSTNEHIALEKGN